MMGLTHKQRELLDYIGSCMAQDGICPTYEEMKWAMGLKSKSGIHRLIDALEERGFIQRIPNRARAIEILDTPRPLLRPRDISVRPLRNEPDDRLIAEMEARGFHIERRAA